MSLSVTPAASAAIYLYTAPTDMRKGFAGLCGLVESASGLSGGRVIDGGLFVFVNRRRDRMKVLHFDGDGLVLWYKQLEAGRFQMPTPPADVNRLAIDATQLRLILDGIDLSSVRRRKRFAMKRPDR